MAHNFTFHSAHECLPLCRPKLFSEVLVEKLYGEITNIWQHPSHVFVSTDDGRKLFTFDCKPVHPQHGFGNSSLDIQNSPSSIKDVILMSPSLAIVVEKNGRTQWWNYSAGYDWLYVGSMELCSDVNSRVLSVSYLPTPGMLIWCERNELQESDMSDTSLLSEKSNAMFSIKGKAVVVSDATAQALRDMEIVPSVTLVTNCPECDVVAINSDKIFIRTKVEKDRVTVSLMCDAELKDLSLFLGQDRFDISSSSVSKGLDFRSFLLKHLTTVIKMESSYGDLGFKMDKHRLVCLSSCGRIEVFSVTDSTSRLCHQTIPISSVDFPTKDVHWFLHNKYIGIIHHQKLSLYSINDGTCLCNWTSEKLSDIITVAQTSSPSILAWILSPNGLLGLQAAHLQATRAFTSAEHLPDNDLLQTAALQLAHCHQLKQQGYNKDALEKLDILKQAWLDGKGSHQSQILELLAPLLEEYWRLDSKSKALLDTDKLQDDQEASNSNRFTEELSKISALPRRVRESRMLWLSQIYPQNLLNFLCTGITLDCDEVPDSEMSRWQILLGVEGWDLSKFELVCRLLFLHYPQKLYHFVKCAESVSERTVGVSAFVRKKHSLVYYKSATECLPMAECSCLPSVAAAVQGKLILASEGDNSVEQALKHFLHHKLWPEAVDLVKRESSKQDKLPCYLYMTMTALAKDHSLSDFILEIFALMPSWKSFLSFTQVASKQPEIREQQLSTSASDLFCHGQNPSVTLGAVKPQLVELIKKMDQS